MTGENENTVQDMERVEIEPAQGGEVITPEHPEGIELPEGEKSGEYDPENDPEDEAPDDKTQERVVRQQNQIPPAEGTEDVAPGGTAPAEQDLANPYGIKRIPGEPAAQFALRLELAKTRGQLRDKRTGEIMEGIRPGAPTAAPRQLSDHAKEVLAKYPKEQLDALKEVMPALAEELGFVRKDELQGNTYAEKAQEQLDSFLERHPEYLPEKDPEGTLWQRFSEEFKIFKQPENPKDYARLFQKAHQAVFGIQAGGALPKIQAQQKKVQVASHAGASGPTSAQRQMRPGSNVGAGLRLDALKGFSDEDKERIAARAGE
jgi:hypothetical protein